MRVAEILQQEMPGFTAVVPLGVEAARRDAGRGGGSDIAIERDSCLPLFHGPAGRPTGWVLRMSVAGADACWPS